MRQLEDRAVIVRAAGLGGSEEIAAAVLDQVAVGVCPGGTIPEGIIIEGREVGDGAAAVR